MNDTDIIEEDAPQDGRENDVAFSVAISPPKPILQERSKMLETGNTVIPRKDPGERPEKNRELLHLYCLYGTREKARRYFKAKRVGEELGMTTKEAGTMFGIIQREETDLIILKEGYSKSTTWQVERNGKLKEDPDYTPLLKVLKEVQDKEDAVKSAKVKLVEDKKKGALCSDCGLPTYKGYTYRFQRLRAFSMQHYGKLVCWNCHYKRIEKAIRDGIAAGKSQGEICEILNLTQTTLAVHYKRLGIDGQKLRREREKKVTEVTKVKKEKMEVKDMGRRDKGVVDENGHKMKTRLRVLDLAKQGLTPAEIGAKLNKSMHEDVLRLAKAGKTAMEIADALDSRPATIYKHLSVLRAEGKLPKGTVDKVERETYKVLREIHGEGTVLTPEVAVQRADDILHNLAEPIEARPQETPVTITLTGTVEQIKVLLKRFAY